MLIIFVLMFLFLLRCLLVFVLFLLDFSLFLMVLPRCFVLLDEGTLFTR